MAESTNYAPDIAKYKPRFSKLETATPKQHCGNYYAKIVKVDVQQIGNPNNEKPTFIARGEAGDETGVIEFKVRGPYAEILKVDNVYAFRNCYMRLIQRKYVQLEIDQWGAITEENASYVKSVNTEKNHSKFEFVKKRRNEIEQNVQKQNDNRPRNRKNSNGGNQNRRNDRPRNPDRNVENQEPSRRRGNRGKQNREERSGDDQNGGRQQNTQPAGENPAPAND